MEIIALALFVLSTSGTPGPNNIMLLSSGVNFGVKKSLPHIFGINLGFPIMVVAVGLGLAAMFQAISCAVHVNEIYWYRIFALFSL